MSSVNLYSALSACVLYLHQVNVVNDRNNVFIGCGCLCASVYYTIIPLHNQYIVYCP